MKKLFLFLLEKYTKTEEDRLIVFNILHDKVSDTYSEQTTFGNVYNSNVEFIMSNDFVNSLVKKNDTKSIEMIKNGLTNSFDAAIKYIKNEQ